MRSRGFFRHLHTALLVSTAVACAGDGTGLDENGNPLVDIRVTISEGELALAVGGTFQLSATVTDDEDNVLVGRAVTWASSNEDVAMVDGVGQVTALGPGAAVISAGTDGASGQTDLVVVASAAFAADVQPIFDANCAFTGCHAGAQPQQGQNLSVGNAFANIVNVPSMELPTMLRINPGNPSMSYLVHKIRGTQLDVGGSGGRMPLGGGALPDDLINTIRAWVQSGALNN